ncbi:hypothetical protein CI238_00930 [Colletotrichum incanum]|uniref:Uncharacterized protein n=1 Tax=Colletotrichum incanum TaxID=1573173 RepID=A0A161VM57_COLIC|nr:hypothetical protein CI238_00930 [Colletotrichum incanum]OHW94491.1 hypothetical protein CSPAE12_06861 [Colletotrichum incanum]
MHFINKILHVCVALQVVFQGASGAILRGRTSGADSVQLPASDLNALSLAAEDLDNQLDSFLRNWGGGHRKPDIVEIANIAKRQAGSIQISPQDLQDLLRLIQSIERQLAAIIASGGSSASGTAVPPPSNTVSDPGPISSSPTQSKVQSTATENDPAGPSVSPPTPSPFLTSSSTGNGEPLTTAYATSVATSSRCKTTVTQTFTEYVYEDGSSAVPRVVRSVVEVDEDEDEDEAEDPDSSTTQYLEQDDDWEPWVEFDGTTVEEDGSDVGFTTRDTWASLGVTHRDPDGVSDDAVPFSVRDELNL